MTNIHRELEIYRALCTKAHDAMLDLNVHDTDSPEGEACIAVYARLDRLARDKATEIAVTFDRDGEKDETT